jgi:hypothetical protein
MTGTVSRLSGLSLLARRWSLLRPRMILMVVLSSTALSSVFVPTVAQAATQTTDWGASASSPCDGLDTSQCMLPFPNDYYTTSSSSTVTGRRISFPPGALPVANGASPIDPAPWEQNDGFSPGSTILTHVPGISLSASGIATISDMGRSLAKDSPVVLLDVGTKKLWPTWSELDVADPDSSTRLLMVHPARNLTEGQRYIVALRDLRTSAGALIAPPAAFAAAVLGSSSASGYTPLSAAYAAHLRGVVATLSDHGVSTRGLYLAWDFTVASRPNLTSTALDMRNEVFAQLGSGVPSFKVTNVVTDPRSNPSLSREISGTFDVPSFLTQPAGVSGTELVTNSNGNPVESGLTEEAAFDCEIPKKATASHPAHVGVYGHGLFNSSTEVYSSDVPQFSDAYDYVFCGTDWYGLSSSTVALAASIVTNFGGFPSLADSLLQSLLDAQVLGHLMDNPKGFAANSAFETSAGRPLINPRSGLVYYGNSEGGIMGGAFTAVSTEVRRSVLGVPGMDYSVLLPRSADFTPFVGLLDSAYPSKAVQQVGFDLVQMLWDRAEADGYAEQMTGGLPGTPSHRVLLEEAFGDHQVANIATEDEARTIGAAIREPALSKGRSTEAQPFWDLLPLRSGDARSALVVWDSGVPPAPLTDTPPTRGNDPHDTVPRNVPAFWRQMNTFFTTGTITNTCGSGPCKAPYPPSGS